MSKYEELSKLKELLDAGVLSKEEFEAEKKKILDICSVTKGASAIQKTIPGQYPMVVTTSERKSSNNFQFDTKAVCIPLVSSRGHGVASLNHVYYQEGKFALGNILCAVVPKDEDKVLAQYLYYYFECTKDKTLVPLMKGGANVAMKVKDVESVKVIIPDITHSINKQLTRTLYIVFGSGGFTVLCESEYTHKQRNML